MVGQCSTSDVGVYRLAGGTAWPVPGAVSYETSRRIPSVKRAPSFFACCLWLSHSSLLLGGKHCIYYMHVPGASIKTAGAAAAEEMSTEPGQASILKGCKTWLLG